MNPDILFAGQLSVARVRAVSRAAEVGEVRRILPGVYTSNLDSPVEVVVRHNWATIVSYLLPGGVLALRSALEQRPADGVLYVSRGHRRRAIEMPGLVIKVVPESLPVLDGPAPDCRVQEIYLPSEERGLLENLVQTRGKDQRVLPLQEIESRLDKILTVRGVDQLNDLRNRARVVAGKLEMLKELAKLEALIATRLGEKKKRRGVRLPPAPETAP